MLLSSGQQFLKGTGLSTNARSNNYGFEHKSGKIVAFYFVSLKIVDPEQIVGFRYESSVIAADHHEIIVRSTSRMSEYTLFSNDKFNF